MSIFDVRHQERAHRTLQRALACERMPHAYLFAGPEGVGKEMLAVRLAQLLLCESPVRAARMTTTTLAGSPAAEAPKDAAWAIESPVDACGHCQSCQLVPAGTHPDLLLIYRQLNKVHPDSTIRKQKALTLSVDVIRQFVIERAGTRPVCGRARVFIIREAERMNDAAQNSLLKTLEEPPEDTFLILLTSAMDRMLPTTRSRCQQVTFQALPADYVAERLRELRPQTELREVAFVARYAGGSLGAALRLIDDGVFAMKRNWGPRLVELLNPARGFAPHAMAKPLTDDARKLGECVAERDPDVSDTDATRAGLQTLLGMLAGFYQDALRQATGAGLPLINEDQADVVARVSSALRERLLVASLREIAQADAGLGQNAHTELALESLFIGLAGVAASARA